MKDALTRVLASHKALQEHLRLALEREKELCIALETAIAKLRTYPK